MKEAILQLTELQLINNSMLYYLLELQVGEAKAKRVYTKIFQTINKEYEKQLKNFKIAEFLKDE